MVQRRALALLMSIALTGIIQGQSAAALKAFQRGAQAMHSNDFPAAATAFRDAIRLDPSFGEAHLDLGLVLGHDGNLNGAVASIRRALQVNPKLSGAHMFLGIFLFQANQVDEARKALREEIRLNPDNTEALTWLGNIEMAVNHAGQAAALFDRAAELDPKDLSVLELSGRAHSEAAKESYRRMAQLDPDSWHVHRVQAQLYAAENRHTDAIQELQAAISKEKGNPDLYELLGDEYLATSQLELAESAYRQEQQLAPANPIALYNLGSTLVERGDAEHGVPLLEQANRLYPGSPTLEYYLGRGLALLNRNEEASTMLASAARGDAEGEIGKRSFFELARVDRKLHRMAEAQAATDNYNRIRTKQEQASSEQVQTWRKLQGRGTSEAQPSPAAH